MNEIYIHTDALYWQFRWRLACASLAISIVVVIIIFHDDIAAAVHQWLYVSSYGYCLLILPLIGHMVWTNRGHLRDLAPEPWPWGAAGIVLFGVAWSLAYASGITEAAQFAIIGMIQGLLLTLFGPLVYRRLWLPFTYLWLLVPTGEFLIPALQQATAIGSAHLLDLSGIPTYRENLTIMVPSGSYVVAPGCSGLSFLLSALVISVTFADTFFRNRRKKIVFVLSALVLSIGANALRVFLIIAIADVTHNIADIADDHLLYGWVFFSLLLLGALAVGYRFRDIVPPQPPGGPRCEGPPVALSRTAWSLVLALIALAGAPLAVAVMLPEAGESRVVVPALSCGTFHPVGPRPLWRTPATLPNVDAVAALDCERNGRTVHLALALLERPIRRGKLIGRERWLIDRDHWTRLETRHATALIDGHEEPIQAERIGRGDTRRLVWSLFWTGGGWHRAGLDTFLADLMSELTGHRRAAAVLVGTDDAPEAAALLREFLAGVPLGSLVNGALPWPLVSGVPPRPLEKTQGR